MYRAWLHVPSGQPEIQTSSTLATASAGKARTSQEVLQDAASVISCFVAHCSH